MPKEHGENYINTKQQYDSFDYFTTSFSYLGTSGLNIVRPSKVSHNLQLCNKRLEEFMSVFP